MPIVIPSPSIESDWNLATRDYEDRVFRWGLVIGLDTDLGQVIEVVSYNLEITPDLGWPDPDEMFTEYVQGDVPSGNSKLTTMPGLSLASDLNDVGDESVSYTVPLDTMKRLLTPGYEKYLWRVVPIGEDGTIGTPSSIQRFSGRVLILETEWTIDPVNKISRGITVKLTGTKSVSVSYIEIDGSTGWTSFPSDTTWEAEVPLSGGTTQLTLRAIDSQGHGSEYRTVELEVSSSEIAVHSLWNTFDEFGYLLDLPRLSGENNVSFRDRITDVYVHRASPRYTGLLNAINRELDLRYCDQAILLSPVEHEDSNLKIQDILVWLTPSYLYVTAPRMIKRQVYSVVDPHTLTTVAEDLKTFGDLTVESPIGVRVPEKDYVLRADVIKFLDPKYAGSVVYLSYQYVEKISIVGKTVGDLIDDINGLEFGGTELISAELGIGSDETFEAEGLVRFRTLLSERRFLDASGREIEGKYPVRWSEARLYSLTDKAFRDQYLNEHGSFFGSKYDAWAMRLKNLIRTTWGYLVADENVWSSRSMSVSGVGSLNSVYDAFRSGWRSSTGEIFTEDKAREYGYKDPVTGEDLVFLGLPAYMFWSGTGDGDDLYVSLGDLVSSEVDVDLNPSSTVLPTSADQGDPSDSLELGVVDSSSEVQ